MVQERSRRSSVETNTLMKLEHANQWNRKIEKYVKGEQFEKVKDSSAIKCSKIDRQPEVGAWTSVGLAEVGVWDKRKWRMMQGEMR